MSDQPPHAYVNPHDTILDRPKRLVPPGTAPGQPTPSTYIPRLPIIPHPPPPTPHAILTGVPPLPPLRIPSPPPEPWVSLPRAPHVAGHASFAPVAFSAKGVIGVRVADVLRGRLALDGAGERVLAGHGWKSVPWMICWPGYEVTHTARVMSVVDAAGAPITRAQLAQEICRGVDKFFKNVAAGTYPTYQQTPGNSQWAVGAGKITIEDVRLVALHYYRNVFVAEFFVKV